MAAVAAAAAAVAAAAVAAAVAGMLGAGRPGCGVQVVRSAPLQQRPQRAPEGYDRSGRMDQA
jgi:hypothetical protein